MNIYNKNIDSGKPFDFGNSSENYARYRDIYPKEFYNKILERRLCIKGHSVLDIGTGTGVIPRNLYSFGATFTGTDISKNQIEWAKFLSEKAGMDIEYLVVSAEDMNFPDESFNVITACQCFGYFNHEKLIPNLQEC